MMPDAAVRFSSATGFDPISQLTSIPTLTIPRRSVFRPAAGFATCHV
jgi:hypothetical protein